METLNILNRIQPILIGIYWKNYEKINKILSGEYCSPVYDKWVIFLLKKK